MPSSHSPHIPCTTERHHTFPMGPHTMHTCRPGESRRAWCVQGGHMETSTPPHHTSLPTPTPPQSGLPANLINRVFIHGEQEPIASCAGGERARREVRRRGTAGATGNALNVGHRSASRALSRATTADHDSSTFKNCRSPSMIHPPVTACITSYLWSMRQRRRTRTQDQHQSESPTDT